MPNQLPGANILSLMMQAPSEVMGLATRQVTEAVDTFGVGMQRLGAELAVPPEIAGLPGLPPFPGMTSTPPATVGAAQAAPPIPAQSRDVTRSTERSRIII